MLERLSPNTRTVLRVAAGVGVAVLAGFATLGLLFVGAITLTGCFIDCSEPNPLGGGLLLAGAVGTASTAVTAVAWAAIGWKPPVLRKVAGMTGAVASALALLWAFAA